ncbi:penicillin acylase family protein [Roseisolibacter agri]|uniref:Penicillin amidase n=1 Tax=Roseisolibacter agri TaxID=2014610 RepID=A0AA37Q5X7_9BACT|nr:penicillin acylase family protein [Roseisolibacter agri]GLC23566.1 penicillin amidase [Roseisolibacter agri]
MPALPRRAALAAALLLASPVAAQPAPDTLRTPGLRAPVTLLRDSSGIVHIRAANEHDLFFAQGWSAARDRLFQLELWRRQATGTMAEALGARWAARDHGARLFRYRGDAARELAHYHPRGAAIVQAFADGVNAWIDRVARDSTLLPPELQRLGITPGRWTPAVVVSRHNALVGNAETEIDRARAVRTLGAARVAALGVFGPGRVMLDPDTALDVAALSDSALALFRAFRAPAAFTATDVAGAAASSGEREAASESFEDMPEGSNNWAVAGTRTASGKPIVANDPHRTIAVPSLRYWVHLTAPGWDVIGGGEPALPGVAIGHNRHGAWGLTIFGLDQTDLYVYELDPRDHTRYRYRGAWARMRSETDTIRVRGEGPRVVTLRFTRHGPVTWIDSASHRAYAVRAAWLEPGGAPYLASLRLDQARTWDEFRAGLRYAHMPALNWVWGDTSGTIGWQAAGIAPVRRTWSGLLPVPGDGRHEWAGFLPILELPHRVNPREGFVGSANENNVPAGYAHTDAVARTWAEAWRGTRLREALGTVTGATAADMARLQHDETSLSARALAPLLRDVAFEDTNRGALARRARDTLAAWDHVLAASSVPAGVYMMWERTLSRAVTRRAIPADARDAMGSVPLTRVVEWMTRPERAPAGVLDAGDPRAARDALLAATFGEAVGELSTRFGPELARWQYGQARYHHALIRHPLGAALDSAARATFDVGPAPRGGSAHTLNATGSGDNQTAGASFRIVSDVADWDRSLGTNTPGQSGDPRSPHYRDLFGPWAEGRYFRVPYTTRAVEAAAERREVLAP